MDQNLQDVKVFQEKYHHFGIWDYVVFVIMLVACAIIGIYFSLKKRVTGDVVEDYLLGGRKMSVFPISTSLTASWISGLAILGTTTEIYTYGTPYMFTSVGNILTGILATYVFLPVFHEMKISSTYEYLERRFDKKVRLFASIAFALLLIGWLPIVIYVPALAFNQVTGINIHVITPCVCIVCIFYTALGGLRAVVWTDVIQTLLMLGALILIIIKGTLDIGGLDVVWERMQKSGRLELPSFQLDFTDRHSIWSVTIGSGIYWLQAGVLNQNMIQRFMALQTYPQVKRALWVFLLGSGLIITLCCGAGFLVFAAYYDCDPVTTKLVKAKDQLLPLFSMQVLGEYPGMPGLFVAGVFSAALSTLSTGLNSMSDFVKMSFPNRNFSDRVKYRIMKSVAVFFGAFSFAMVFLIEKLETNKLQLNQSLIGITSGPSLGVFCGGMLLPWMNANGAFYGGLLGLGISGFVVLSAQSAIANGQIKYLTKPVSVDGCDHFYNVTSIILTNTTFTEGDVFPLYKMSYFWYTLFGAIVTLVFGILISYFTGFNDPRNVDPLCLSPVIRRYLPRQRAAESVELLSPL